MMINNNLFQKRKPAEKILETRSLFKYVHKLDIQNLKFNQPLENLDFLDFRTLSALVEFVSIL